MTLQVSERWGWDLLHSYYKLSHYILTREDEKNFTNGGNATPSHQLSKTLPTSSGEWVVYSDLFGPCRCSFLLWW